MNNSLSYNTLDAQYKTIQYTKPPTEPDDCANKQYVDKIGSELFKNLKKLGGLLSQFNTDINSVLKTNITCIKQKNMCILDVVNEKHKGK